MSSCSLGTPLRRRAMSERSLEDEDDDTGDDRFLRDVQTLSRALSLVPLRRSSSGDVPRPKPKPPLWRRPLKALSRIGQRRLECASSSSAAAAAAAADAGATRPVRAVGGAAEFEETLTHRCSVYYTRGGYEPRPFAIRAAAVGSPEVDLGTHRVDLARLLPLTAEAMAEEEEEAAGRWSTSLRLSGTARGAMLDVSLGFSILKDGAAADPIAEKKKKISEVLYEKAGGSDRPGQMNDSIGSNEQRRSTEDVKKVLQEIPRGSKSGAPLELDDENSCGGGDRKARSETGEVAKLKSRHYTLLELLKGHSEEDECDETEYTVIEQGVEVSSTDRIGESSKADQVIKKDQMAKETESAFISLSVRGSEEIIESPKIEENLTDPPSYVDRKSNRDSAILSMLGLDESSSELSSDGDPDSPREQLWKQFKKELLASGGNSMFHRDFGEEKVPQDYETEPELNQAVNNKSNAEIVEDEEAETLTRERGLNETSFQYSAPSDSRSGFGSPIDIPSKKTSELPSRGEGLGPFVWTKRGGFLRSMDPTLFANAKNNGSLIMQVSCPIVVPAEMDIERLSMQASKVMPLGDITGKAMRQIAREAAPSLEVCTK